LLPLYADARLETGGFIMLTEGRLLMFDRDDSLMGFWEISLIYFVLVPLIVERFWPLLEYGFTSTGGSLTGMIGDLCFFMFEGTSMLGAV
jgi:hypothetical protein